LSGDAAARLESSEEAWDAFVAASGQPTHLQTTAWAQVKSENGWRAVRVALPVRARVVGAQMLIRGSAGRLPLGLGYVGRGPLTGLVTGDGEEDDAAQPSTLDADALGAFTEKARDVARRLRLAYIRMEPDLAPDSAPVLRGLGWRPAPHVQPESTQVIELGRPLDEVWAGLHRKARQSVNKARRLGITVVEADGSRLSDFYNVHMSAARRAGIVPRAESTYRQMWNVLAPRGMARLLFAERGSSGQVLAALFLVSFSKRVVDLYGGTTRDGDATRANYILKWEAIQCSRAAGFTEYDMWGLPHAGIAQFKKGFGGRELRYVGAWDLVTDQAGRAVLSAGLATRSAYARLRSGRRAGRNVVD
jgi:peptidoglycan pentaglycine glycine transferase (the first glycine)